MSVALQVVKEHYGEFARQEAFFLVRFEDTKISLDIPDGGQVTKEGWRITPRTSPTVSQTVLLPFCNYKIHQNENYIHKKTSEKSTAAVQGTNG